MFIVSFFLFIFFSTPSFAETSSTEKPDSSELAYCGFGGSCRTAYSSPVIETRLARYDPDMFCSGYHACLGLNHYCGSSPAIHTSQAPSTVGQFVMTRWSSYRVWDTKKEKWLSCGLQFEGGEGDLTVDYNKTPTKEDCLARPVINETFIGGRTENGVFATIQGCLYRAQGVVTCDPDNMERCAAEWTPVDIAPCVGEGCTDTEENGGSSGGSGSGSDGSSGGSSGSGNGSGGSSGGSGGSGGSGHINVNVSVDLGTAPNVDLPDISSPSSTSILNQLWDIWPSARDYHLSIRKVACPVFVFDIPLFSRQYQLDSHCSLLTADVLSLIRTIMILFSYISAFFIVLRA